MGEMDGFTTLDKNRAIHTTKIQLFHNLLIKKKYMIYVI
jgi:hypothetical protein